MIYPDFLQKDDTIGICAPSAGVGRKLELFDRSLNVLKNEGWKITETASVRVNDIRSAEASVRGKEFNQLMNDPNVNAVFCAAGGDFLYETLPYINWSSIKKHPKWIVGASDPTSILFSTVTKCDVAAIYGVNAGSFDADDLHHSSLETLKMFHGEPITWHSYDRINSTAPFSDEPEQFDQPSQWESTVPNLHVSGRCIGGCMDVLKDLIGTKFDGMKQFNRKYKEDGTIFFLDNFALSAETFYITLLQMRHAGWLDHTKAVIVGRHLFPSSNTGLTYEEAITRALPDIPVIFNADIGHTRPCMTMIMGSVLQLDYEDKKATLSFSLK